MNKSEQREVTRTIAHMQAGLITATDAVRSLAVVYRAGSGKTQREVEALIRQFHLVSFLDKREHGFTLAL